MGCIAYRPIRKQIDEYLKPMAEFPKNAAMQGMGCKKLLDLIKEYEAPHVMIRLMGRRTTRIVCKCVKTHFHSGVVMRSAATLCAELAKNAKNLQVIRKAKVLHRLQSSAAEFPHEPLIVDSAFSVEAALRGVYDPHNTLETAINDNDADLITLIMRVHPKLEDVQSRGSQAIVSLSRESEEARAKLREKKAVPLLVTALNNFPNNNSVLSNAAAAFRELGRDANANRDAGRDGGIEIMVKALMNLNLWRETHQSILWGLSRLTDIESNIIHMKAARLQFILKEVTVRKMAVYIVNDERLDVEARKRERKEAEEAKKHKKEDEWEQQNRFTDFSTVHPDNPEEDKANEEQLSAFEEFKRKVERGEALYTRSEDGPRRFLTEAEELAYIAKKKRLAQMLLDGSPADVESGMALRSKKKEKPRALQLELAGKAQKTALFVPQKLRNLQWDKYSLTGLEESKKAPEADTSADALKVRSYEDTLDLLLGEEGANKRREAKRRKNMRKPQTAKERNVVKHSRINGAYVG